MMKGRISWGRLVWVLLFAVASTNGLSAQSQQARNDPGALEEKAEAYLEDMEKWSKAADLYRQAAHLRDAADAEAVWDLKTAARLEFYQGSEQQAIRDLETAGHRAMAIGDVVAAANAFADAAWIAGTEGHGSQARELVVRAQLLTESPLIPTADKDDIRSRLPTLQ